MREAISFDLQAKYRREDIKPKQPLKPAIKESTKKYLKKIRITIILENIKNSVFEIYQEKKITRKVSFVIH
jgi:hypothetical protein